MSDIVPHEGIGANADEVVALRGKRIKDALHGTRGNQVVVSEYPDILAGGLFITLKDIEVRS